MIRLYGFDTVNTLKILIMLEETKLDYEPVPINIRAGAHRSADFLKINQNAKVPVIVTQDRDGTPFTLTESGAILQYLADRSGFGLPQDQIARSRTLEWLAFQLSTQGPIFGQCEFWATRKDAIGADMRAHFLGLARRVLDQMEQRLSAHPFFSGPEYSIADIAVFAWMTRAHKINLSFATHAAVRAWFDRVADRPAVQAARVAEAAFPNL